MTTTAITAVEIVALRTAPSGKVTTWGVKVEGEHTAETFKTRKAAQAWIEAAQAKLEPADEPPSGTIVIPEPAEDRSPTEIKAERRAAAYAEARAGDRDQAAAEAAEAEQAKAPRAKLSDDERKARRRERRAARLAKLSPAEVEARKAKRAEARKARRAAKAEASK